MIEISKLNGGVSRLMLENSIIMFFGITDEGTDTLKVMLKVQYALKYAGLKCLFPFGTFRCKSTRTNVKPDKIQTRRRGIHPKREGGSEQLPATCM